MDLQGLTECEGGLKESLDILDFSLFFFISAVITQGLKIALYIKHYQNSLVIVLEKGPVLLIYLKSIIQI